VFGYERVRYRGLAKNTNRIHLLATFSNPLIGEKYLLAWGKCVCLPPKRRRAGKIDSKMGEEASDNPDFLAYL
jgi:hypothetical protein